MQKLAALQGKDFFTLANATCGILSIAAASVGAAWFWVLIPLAIVFDWLDGKVARMTKTVNKLGVQLDSLADIISFSVAPFVAALVVVGASPWVWITGTLFVLAGVVRLAHFNLATPSKFYSGLPVTAGALLAILFILVDTLTRDGGQIAGLALLVFAVLQVSDIRFPGVK